MTPHEVGATLAMAAAFDQRKVGQADVAAWVAAIGDLDFDDARDAVIAHYRDSPDRLMPAHVRQRVAAARRRRLDAAGTAALLPTADPDDPAYAAELRARRDRIASPHGPAALDGPR